MSTSRKSCLQSILFAIFCFLYKRSTSEFSTSILQQVLWDNREPFFCFVLLFPTYIFQAWSLRNISTCENSLILKVFYLWFKIIDLFLQSWDIYDYISVSSVCYFLTFGCSLGFCLLPYFFPFSIIYTHSFNHHMRWLFIFIYLA